jgi:hypothetical protein
MNPTAALFDGTAQLWRETTARSDFGGVQRQHAVVGAPFVCAAQVRNRNRGDLGPGEAEVGEWMVYAPMDATAPLTGDVIQVLTGPEAGKTLRVEDNYTPRGRFRQTRCRQWDGVLP